MTCSNCGGQTASDAASVHWCVLCGSNVTLQREKRMVGIAAGMRLQAALDDQTRIPASEVFSETDTAEYKPLMAEELPQ